MERRRISIFESFLSGGSVGKRARKVQKAALNAWRINYVIVDILSTLSLKVNTFIQAKEDVVGLDWTPMIRILILLPALPQSKGPSNKIYIFLSNKRWSPQLWAAPLWREPFCTLNSLGAAAVCLRERASSSCNPLMGQFAWNMSYNSILTYLPEICNFIFTYFWQFSPDTVGWEKSRQTIFKFFFSPRGIISLQRSTRAISILIKIFIF